MCRYPDTMHIRLEIVKHLLSGIILLEQELTQPFDITALHLIVVVEPNCDLSIKEDERVGIGELVTHPGLRLFEESIPLPTIEPEDHCRHSYREGR